MYNRSMTRRNIFPIGWLQLLYAAVLCVVVVSQLFSLDKLTKGLDPSIGTWWVPLLLLASAVSIFGLAYTLNLTMSTSFRYLTQACAMITPFMWFLAVCTAWDNNMRFGMFGVYGVSQYLSVAVWFVLLFLMIGSIVYRRALE